MKINTAMNTNNAILNPQLFGKWTNIETVTATGKSVECREVYTFEDGGIVEWQFFETEAPVLTEKCGYEICGDEILIRMMGNKTGDRVAFKLKGDTLALYFRDVDRVAIFTRELS